MNKFTILPNRIKQPAICCVYCGKGYKSRTGYEKHAILCELIDRTKKKKKLRILDDDDEVMPSNRQMYHMLLELSQKYSTLEKKMEEMSKFVVKQKKKVNILEWLNNNLTPAFVFDELPSKITTTTQTIELLLNNTFHDILNDMFESNIYKNDELCSNNINDVYPLFSLTQKSNTFYYYTFIQEPPQGINQQKHEWRELTKDKLVWFLNIIHMKITKLFTEWKKIHRQEISENDSKSTICDKATIKLMSQEFKEDKYYTKVKSLLYNKMKCDMKTLIEYEFEV
jgi:hypothetical protein